jgi:bacillithiol system protein YtxJ
MSKISELFGKTKAANWNTISQIEDLDKINELSFSKPQIIFKHSTRCSISSMAKKRLEDGIAQIQLIADIYYLDLIAFRNISDEIEKRFGVPHESPQIIILKNGVSVYDASHNMVIVEEIIQHLGEDPTKQ